jgi:hypothetical protein
MKKILMLIFLLMISVSVYAGQCVSGDCSEKLTGKGSAMYSDGVYGGEFKNGLRSGKGQMTYFDGGVYVGEWRNDTCHGQGRLIWNGGLIDGKFRNGQYIGK